MRDNSVSIAKALAIILMVLGHSLVGTSTEALVNMFHMPLFFFFSGYFFKEKYLSNIKEYATKKVTGIYLPFVKWSIVFLLLHNVFCSLNLYNEIYGAGGPSFSRYSLITHLRKLVSIVSRMGGVEPLLGGYWFLKSLFVASFLGYFAIKYLNPRSFGGIILLALSLISKIWDFNIPYFDIGSTEFVAASFFVFGHNYKTLDFHLEDKGWIIIPSILLITLGAKYWKASMINFSSWTVLPYTITALAGTLAVFMISKKINRTDSPFKNYLVFTGNNTMSILTWHMLSLKVVSLAIIIFNKLPIERLAEFPAIVEYSKKGWFIPYTLFGVILPLLVSMIGDKIQKHNSALKA